MARTTLLLNCMRHSAICAVQRSGSNLSEKHSHVVRADMCWDTGLNTDLQATSETTPHVAARTCAELEAVHHVYLPAHDLPGLIALPTMESTLCASSRNSMRWPSKMDGTTLTARRSMTDASMLVRLGGRASSLSGIAMYTCQMIQCDRPLMYAGIRIRDHAGKKACQQVTACRLASHAVVLRLATEFEHLGHMPRFCSLKLIRWISCLTMRSYRLQT